MSSVELREQITKTIQILPEDSLTELMTFLQYLQYRDAQEKVPETPYVPVALDGLWDGITIEDEDIKVVRQEMWGNY